MFKNLTFLLVIFCLCLIGEAHAAQIIWVSFHGAGREPSAGAAEAGFIEAPDKRYTDLLKAYGYDVIRYVQTSNPDPSILNAADLIIIGRSVASTSFQNIGATLWNNITTPMIIMGGYTLRSSRMGYTTGGTMVDTNGDITLTASDPNHPIFTGIPLTNGTMNNPFSGVVYYPTDGVTLARGISINIDPVNTEGRILAAISEAGNGPVGGMVIGEWPAGALLTHDGGAGVDVLAGPRLVFLSGAREASGMSSETAGLYDLYEDGARIFLNAVALFAPVPAGFSDVTKPGDPVQGIPNDGDWPNNEHPGLAFDDNVSTKYLHFKGDFVPEPYTGGAGLRISPSGRQTVIVGLTFTTANDFPGRDPTAFELSGSNESIAGPYELIATGEIVDFQQETEWPRFTKNKTSIIFENKTAYDHYQVLFTAIRGPVGGLVNSVQIAEIELLGDNLIPYNPTPANGSSFVESNTLRWSPADKAFAYRVYLSTVPILSEADLVEETSLTEVFVANLIPGTRYYWRVDIIEADGTIIRGDIWNFTTTLFPVALSSLFEYGFEDYGNGSDPQKDVIFDFWSDGFGDPDNGAEIGYRENFETNFLETQIVHSGSQSFPYSYDGPSRATRTFDPVNDWAQGEPTVLSLWFKAAYAPSGSFTERSAGTYRMTASGTDIWGMRDEFHFAYRKLSGIGSITARIESIQGTNGWAKAGVMIRETLDPGSMHAFVCITPGNGVASQGRLNTGGLSYNTNQPGITAPHWVRLTRDDANNFTVSHSADGTTWEPVQGAESRNIPMGADVYIGLALTAHNSDVFCEAAFSATITGMVNPTWLNRDIGILSNSPERISVTITDDMNDSEIVYHPDPAATQRQNWTRWNIDLGRFVERGVNLARISNFSIGVGDQIPFISQGNVMLFANGSSAGSGKLLFDDFELKRGVGPADLTIKGYLWDVRDGKEIKGAIVKVDDEDYFPDVTEDDGFYRLNMPGANPNADYGVTVSAGGYIENHPDILIYDYVTKNDLLLTPDMEALPNHPLYCFRSLTNSNYFYTLDEYISKFDKYNQFMNIPTERNALLLDPDNWIYEGIAFCGEVPGSASTSPVHRFQHRSSDVPSYALNETDLDGDPADWIRIDSNAFWVYENPQPNTIPVHRFWNPNLFCYYYTTEEVGSKNGWEYKGIVWYIHNCP